MRLWYRENAGQGQWLFVDQTVTATTNLSLAPRITSPVPSTTLTADIIDIEWSTPVETWLYAGSSPGARDYLDSGNLGEVSNAALTNLPVDGSTIFVRLWYRSIAGTGAWEFIDETYTAFTAQ